MAVDRLAVDNAVDSIISLSDSDRFKLLALGVILADSQTVLTTRANFSPYSWEPAYYGARAALAAGGNVVVPETEVEPLVQPTRLLTTIQVARIYETGGLLVCSGDGPILSIGLIACGTWGIQDAMRAASDVLADYNMAGPDGEA